MKNKRMYVFVAVVFMLTFAIFACQSEATVPPTPTPNIVAQGTNVTQSVDTGPRYGTNQLYDMALEAASNIISSRMNLNAWVLGIAFFLLIVLVGWMIGFEDWFPWAAIIVLALVAFGVSFAFVKHAATGRINNEGYALANKAITDGVSIAQKAQATNFQLIHAPVIQIGRDTQVCKRTVNSLDFCSSNTPYYTERDINSHQVCTTTTDSEGNSTTTCHEEHDNEYTPWFDGVVMYWIVPDTKAKYLSFEIYGQRCLADDGSIVDCKRDETGLINDSRHPVIYTSVDWRAPEDVEAHRYKVSERYPDLGPYNNHIPDAWRIPRDSARIGGPVVIENFVGPYFNYGLATEDTQFQTYAGHYQDLINITALPGPNGVTFDYTDAYGDPSQLVTQLYSSDGDLPVNLYPVTTIGTSVDPTLLAELQNIAMQFQGDFGPNPTKHGSARWFLVSDSIVQKLGGMENTTAAIKAYLNDVRIWGLFALPKNLVIIVSSVSDDGKTITSRDMATGMPFGNTIVMQDMRMSIPAGTTLPLTPADLIGTFTANYAPTNGDTFTYSYPDLSQAGGAASILYWPDPNYKAPDPNSTDCVNANPEHKGFILYSMCALQYKESTIKINQRGADLIMKTVEQGATEATPHAGYWITLGVVIFLAFGAAYTKSQL